MRANILILLIISLSGLGWVSPAPAQDKTLQTAVAAYENYDFQQAYALFSQIEHPEAFYYLGRIHEYGRGLPADYPKAASYYEKAAMGGNARAMHRLAIMHHWGRGISQDNDLYVAWLLKAAQAGDYKAAELLSAYYEQGWRSLPEDMEKHRYWLEQYQQRLRVMAMAGDREAMYDFGMAYMNYQYEHWVSANEAEEQTRRANLLLWLEKAAAKNSVEAINALMGAYLRGDPYLALYSRDEEKFHAMAKQLTFLVRKGAQQKDAISMAALGGLYYYNFGNQVVDNDLIPLQDLDQAAYWLELAWYSGQVDAMGHYLLFHIYQLTDYHFMADKERVEAAEQRYAAIIADNEELLQLARHIGELGDEDMFTMLVKADKANSTYWQQKLDAINN